MAQPIEKYGASTIRVLGGLEGVRKRPSMYIGNTSKEGLHHLVYEVVDNSIDECMVGVCDLINIIINNDGSLTVKDNGRGIPTDLHPIHKKSAMEIVLTQLHAGGKFEKNVYQISGGLHGVGLSCVNALSKKLIATVKRDGKIYKQEYKMGKSTSKVEIIGNCNIEEHGTEIRFFPDEKIFSTIKFDFNVLTKRLRELAYLNPNLKIILEDKENNKKEIFNYSGGLMEFVEKINKGRSVLNKPIYFKKQTNSKIIEIAIQYTESYNENIFGFVNTINTTEGGTHISGFKTALTRAINDYVLKKNLLKKEKLNGNDIREGITAIISLKIPNPQFEGQTKTKLGNSEIKGVVDSMVYVSLANFLEENPGISKKIVQKIISSAKARNAAKKARDLVRRKNILGFSGLPGKLSDCSTKKFEDTELYLVEGDSAAGSSKMARDKNFQAILPLKGKILNVEKSNPNRALSSEEITGIITAVGTGVRENFNLKKLRYNKIIIMTDADVDGQHITALLLTFFFRYLPELIENGNIYVAVPPLYRVRKSKDYYIYSDDELKKLMNNLGGKADVQRFKGLGEMNPGQLWDTTMNPKKRILKKITIEDSVIADATFSMLMGSEVGPRKKFIEINAEIAEIDI